MKTRCGVVLLFCVLCAPWARAQSIERDWEIERGPRRSGRIALTFDAGGDADCFFDLIRILADAKVASTFFITGKWARENPRCAVEIRRHGHEVGNHTWSHLDLTQQLEPVIREELLRAEVYLTKICGQNPWPYWRAPFGARDARVLDVTRRLGYRSIYWTLDSLDSVDPPKSARFLVDRITRRSDAQMDGAIILLHVGVASTAEALPEIIANLQGRGFELVTVSKLLTSPGR